MSKSNIQIITGILLGAVLPIIGVYIVMDARPELIGLQKYSNQDLIKHVNTQIITLGMIINAAVFFLGLQLNKEFFSRGILISSILYLIALFIYRFLL